MKDPTHGVDASEQADRRAAQELLPRVYAELRHLAAVKMASQPAGHTLQPTALVHEAYLRLAGSEEGKWQNTRHFYAAAAEAMRHVLIDAARKKGRLKRGGEPRRINLEEIHLAVESDPDGLLAVDEALEEFAREDPAKAQLVKLRFFSGLTLPQAAEALGLSVATAKRSWAFSRAWLYRRLSMDT